MSEGFTDEEVLQGRIRKHLRGRDDLLKNPDDLYPLQHPLAGHCFIASQVYMLLSDRDLTPEQVTVSVPEPGPTGETVEFSHWYLRDADGEVVDLTEDQFTSLGVDIPYDEGRGRGFGIPGGAPCKRASKALEGMGESP